MYGKEEFLVDWCFANNIEQNNTWQNETWQNDIRHNNTWQNDI